MRWEQPGQYQGQVRRFVAVRSEGSLEATAEAAGRFRTTRAGRKRIAEATRRSLEGPDEGTVRCEDMVARKGIGDCKDIVVR